MLPPGIFCWKSGVKGRVEPFDIEAVSALHPSWADELEEYGPWSNEVSCEEAGEFVQGAKQSEATIVVTGQCQSTMESARFLVENGVLGEWGTVVSVEQVGGRGQLRRPWMSPPGNLHMSVVLPSMPLGGAWEGKLSKLLPLVAGYLVNIVLGELGAELKVKWPNDLLQENRKVGGMLIEEKEGVFILGLGLNLAECPSDSQMREDHSVSAGVLKTKHRLPGPLRLGDYLVNRGKNVYVVLLDENTPSRFVTTLESHLAWYGLMVEIREGGGASYRARIIGLSPEGGLVIQCGGRESVLVSGSIFPL